ncbi:MAG: response regulator [Chitinivibrionales bacterium]|nr:response regulator [Chitinivibrionales bacterium]
MVALADPYVHLRGSFRVLLVDRDERTLAKHQDIIEEIPLIEAHTARSAAEATRMLYDGRRWHAVVTDLGIDDINGDEYALMRRFGDEIPFVVCSSQASLEKGLECARFGARLIVQKHGAVADRRRLKERVAYCVQLSIINPAFRPGSTDSLSRATDALFTKCPQSVSEWSSMTHVTERELRYLWRKNSGAAVKEVLGMYHIVSSAFAYHLNGAGTELWKAPPASDTDVQERLTERFLQNRRAFERMALCGAA